MKKMLALILVGVIGVAALVGCSAKEEQVYNQSTEENTDNGEATVPTVAASEEEETHRTVATIMGEVIVPVNPQRIVVNWYLGDVYALGIKPVAAYGWLQESMVFYKDLADVPLIENWDEETIMSYDPDLIVTYSQDDFDKFSKIAPVLVIPESTVTSVERLAFLGEATGHEEEANAVIRTSYY